MYKMGKQNEDIDEYEFHRRQTAPSMKAMKKKKPINIKYIASPMMVKASNASEFRAIVQQHTGQNAQLKTTTSRRPGSTIHKSYFSTSKEELVDETPNTKQLLVNVVEDTLLVNPMSINIDHFDNIDTWF